MGLATVDGLWAARQELPKAGNGRKPALWRVISGFEAGKEDELAPGERSAGLRKLAQTFVRVLKSEFQAQQAERAAARHEDDALSPSWNPVARVCAYLSVAESMLTRLVNEVSGYSAQQLADRERIRQMQPLLKAELEAFVRREVGASQKLDYDERCASVEEMQWTLFKRWKAYKASNWRESTASRAARFGFKYAARYRQACLMEYGVTPDGMEFEALKEIATYFAACEGLARRTQAIEYPMHARGILEYAQKPYQDLWAVLWDERREWLLAMKEQWGFGPGSSSAEMERHMAGD